ncbi:acyltransferase [Pseudomonas sp. RTC3]|uniref:acyltransferase n=1 Tax=unclassified Pseudomonas TaxID=196821 RepID=UPI002AB3893E|nr:MULTISPECIES: acyltransferase [unclassified Pseudomonas]MEB0064155.1 acyltransferase [Pseudomonas sp. RTC3]MDY7565988.1 acyltransferase [Pseudomonas sp. 5C2]MEB0007613.1 acyltransferase [Pseudomonas sp. RTB2]MEB0018840.1 acyltransferase [Pseudomonas sp. RTB3]MEB0239326.1 acyltransferase [Pseudomonas sp. 5C2]
MAYLTDVQLQEAGFKALGKHVKISDKASIYNADQIEIGDFSRIDDFCVISGRVSLGKYNHITPMCLVAGGIPGIVLEDFCTLAYGVKVFSQSDDYSGETLTNSLVPKKFKNEKLASVHLQRHVIVGAGAIIFPGVTVAEGCSIGAMALVTKSTSPWGIYTGIPAQRVKNRKKDLLKLELEFLDEQKNDSI